MYPSISTNTFHFHLQATFSLWNAHKKLQNFYCWKSRKYTFQLIYNLYFWKFKTGTFNQLKYKRDVSTFYLKTLFLDGIRGYANRRDTPLFQLEYKNTSREITSNEISRTLTDSQTYQYCTHFNFLSWISSEDEDENGETQPSAMRAGGKWRRLTGSRRRARAHFNPNILGCFFTSTLVVISRKKSLSTAAKLFHIVLYNYDE